MEDRIISNNEISGDSFDNTIAEVYNYIKKKKAF